MRVESGLLDLTPPGRARREAIRRKIREFEKLFLADIPESEIAIGRHFLSGILSRLLRNSGKAPGPHRAGFTVRRLVL
jgi:hypothetical protein